MSDPSLAAFAPDAARAACPTPATPPRGRRGVVGAGPDALGLLMLWLRRIEQRRKLDRLAREYPSYLLRDVGLRAEDLMREARKPFWRP
ncbi:MAG: hypothetical protein EA355_16015 [Rhodobacteraceae bacterium]|nr:MAG: hypothetical protein EA355_16015 [Paracoccaceae bacterium]